MLAVSLGVVRDDHGSGMVFFRRLEFLVEGPGSLWEEWRDDVVCWVALLVLITMSGGAWEMFSVVRDSRIMRRDSRFPLSFFSWSSLSTLRDRVLMIPR